MMHAYSTADSQKMEYVHFETSCKRYTGHAQLYLELGWL